MLHLGDAIEPRVMAQIPQTIEIAQRFLRARPWQLVVPEVPIELTIALGGRERRLVASVLGADGIEHGLALHESAEALARFVQLAEEDRRDELMEMSFTSLTIDPEPAWVADAVKAAFGDPVVVVPVANSAGDLRAVTSEELTVLAAAMFAVSKLAPGRLTADVTVEIEGGGQCRATARIAEREAVRVAPLPAWTKRPFQWNGQAPVAVLTVPVLPVADLGAAAAGLRALGFTVTESAEPQSASASWPGLVIELAHAPSAPGGCCHIVVEEIDSLVDVWKKLGVDVHVHDLGGQRVAHIEVPGGLSLTFGTRLPAAYQPLAKPRRRAPRRRVS
jgi:hypothetical protein